MYWPRPLFAHLWSGLPLTNILEHTAMPGDEGDFNAGIMYKTEEEAAEYINSLNNQELVLFFTDFHFPLNQGKFIILSE